MNFENYQVEARKYASYSNVGDNLMFPTLSLNSKSGEIASIVRELHEVNEGNLSPETIINLINALGDELWCIANIASELGVPLKLIAKTNLDKLRRQ